MSGIESEACSINKNKGYSEKNPSFCQSQTYWLTSQCTILIKVTKLYQDHFFKVCMVSDVSLQDSYKFFNCIYICCGRIVKLSSYEIRVVNLG